MQGTYLKDFIYMRKGDTVEEVPARVDAIVAKRLDGWAQCDPPAEKTKEKGK